MPTTVTKEDLDAFILQYLKDNSGKEDATLDMQLADDLGFDSLDPLEFALYIEEKFDVMFDTDTENKLLEAKTGADVSVVVLEYLNRGSK